MDGDSGIHIRFFLQKQKFRNIVNIRQNFQQQKTLTTCFRFDIYGRTTHYLNISLEAANERNACLTQSTVDSVGILGIYTI